LHPVLQKLVEAGASVDAEGHQVTVEMRGRPRPIAVMTEPFPGFPTDLQPPLGAFLSRCEGISLIVETIHPDRLLYLKELSKLGAQVIVEEATNPKRLPCLAWLTGVDRLHAAEVDAHDLRAGAALLLAALSAEGETVIQNAEKLWRGYAHFVDKFTALGARLVIDEIPTKRVTGYAVAQFGD
jgi:UDP-N-acetylglucosamine 1-carboxyvinyltransferase